MALARRSRIAIRISFYSDGASYGLYDLGNGQYFERETVLYHFSDHPIGPLFLHDSCSLTSIKDRDSNFPSALWVSQELFVQKDAHLDILWPPSLDVSTSQNSE